MNSPASELPPLFAVRRAFPSDASAIAAVKLACWPGENADPDHIRRVLDEPDHVTSVATANGTIAGFVDGFLTLAADGARRWEVDLLAVYPARQGYGIGRALTDACTEAGRLSGAAMARALIRMENTASQRVFKHCGYRRRGGICRLVTADADGDAGPIAVPSDAHLIPVNTLGYRGLWIEGILNPAVFVAARRVCARHSLDTTGAVIPAESTGLLEAAAQAGFSTVGAYAWWIRDL